ncbi:TetR family transcriptional regulator [Paractinoplanes deccanensis]|uniref:TetR family transcriptional regulator n=1 Tax=Paractinoplanes deccanensis TaxID=113561 RepID=A0ABQ3YDJ9_9ACTN|nr:TetR/AcrR family transcriptional regulator C-terminal domain-containing protein [Actinoplanes deccanensis]GID78010.1 TetR family transcriptional regulator [Actinoplanes deccanensis]
MPRPRSLHPDRLAEAALAVIDRDGLAGLTMRAVAAELGMSTMALYRYVADRSELELLVADWCLRDLDTSLPPAPQWTDQIKILVLRVRDQIGTHQQAVPLLIANRQRSRPLLRWAEAVTTVLDAAGFTGTDRVIALRGLVGYLNGALLQEHLGALGGTGTETIAAQTDFPMMRDTARAARHVSPEDEFAGGLDIVLRGLSRSGPAPAGPASW